MKTSIWLVAVALLSACSVVPPPAWIVVPPQAWTFDPTQPQPPKMVLPAAEVAALTDRVAQLQLQRNEIRMRVAEERDALKRQVLYEQLHRIGMQLSPLQRTLTEVAAAR